jgi:hypothetical protein
MMMSAWVAALSPSPSWAGYLAQGATVVAVTNTSSNQQAFSVKLSGGTGPCVSGGWVSFKEVDAADAKTF